MITGAAAGIGRDITERFLAGGTRVVALDRDKAALESLMTPGYRQSLMTAVADVSAADQVQAAVDEALSRFGAIHILVNNAGIVRHAEILDMAADAWRDVIDINLGGAFHCAQIAGRAMARARYGRIVNISSHAALRGTRGRGAYSAAKAGMIALTRVLAVELADRGITANAIAPGAIETPRVAKEHSEARRQAWASAIPLGRYGAMEELASAVFFLASPQSGYITGQTIGVDGGFQIAGIRAGA